MLISGFTIVRNACKFSYPVLESIRSILPICDEFVVNVGDSEDDTLALIRSLQDPKIRIIESRWDMSRGKLVLSDETNRALQACRGTWGFYLQTDEVIHEDDLPRLRRLMERYARRMDIEAMRFNWLHFFGSYYRYRIDAGWYQKQDRIIRNNGRVISWGDAYCFKRADDQPICRVNTGCLLYHYGWVQSGDVMTRRRVNAENIGFTRLADNEREEEYTFGDLNRFHPYFGSHPAVMQTLVEFHDLSREDKKRIDHDFRWHPLRLFKVRYKTGKRVKEKIQ